MNKRIWLITGASSGIGKAIAEAIIESGDFVLATFRREVELQEFDKAHNGNAKGVLLDISSIDKIESTVDQLISEYGKIDVCLLYTSPSPRDKRQSRMPSSA